MRHNKIIRLAAVLLAILLLLAGCENPLCEIPFSSYECYGKHYEEIVAAFEGAGFTNVKTEADPDLVLGFLAQDGDVESVSVNGTTSFTKGAYLPKDSAIVVRYHTFPTDQSQTETASPAVPEKETVYDKLSDQQFLLLTEAVAKSFYSFSLPDEEYQVIAKDQQTMDCLTRIYNYAHKNYFELEPDYQAAFAKRFSLIEAHPCYETLTENFMISVYRDSANDMWIHEIHSYCLNPDDVIIQDGTVYIDAEGYLKIGTEIYWEEDGSFQKVGKIVDIAYDKEIDGTVYGYALNVEFYDDPYSSGWTDGEILLAMNKNFGGKAIYYVAALDANRNIIKEHIDYNSSVVWKPLNSSNCKKGQAVYAGIRDTKTLTFTIVDIDVSKDIMTVCYPNGTVENKSYSAMLSLGYLYIQ